VEMRLLLLLPLLGGPTLVNGQCCPTLVVTGMADLDDTYTLASDKGDIDKPEEVCNDGCVYTRANPVNPDDEYCFKTEMSSGEGQCQDLTSLKDDVSRLENEVRELEQDENDANNLNIELDKVDEKVEELTSDVTPSGRVQRQEGPPTTCDEIADIIEQLADTTKTNAERLVLVQRILQTTIKKCKSKDKLMKTKVKIKRVKTETGERIKLIVIKKSKKNAEIKEKTKLILLIESAPTAKPPPAVSLKPTGQIGVPINSTGEQGISIDMGGSTFNPTGEIVMPIDMGGSTFDPTGEIAVPIDMGGSTFPPTGEIAIPIDVTGQYPVPITGTGEIAIPINATGQQAVEITGQQAVEINQTGQQAVLFTEELSQSTMASA